MRKTALLLLTMPLAMLSCSIRDKKPDAPAYAATGDPYRQPLEQIREAELMLKEGDLVVRDGQEFTSQIIKNFNRHNKNYSHAGMVFIEDGQPVVYHILPGEENPSEKLIRDSLSRFGNPRKNGGFAIYRYNLNAAEVTELHTQFKEWYAQGIKFDSLFNLRTDDRMYCSEMIRKGLAKATNQRIVPGTTKLLREEAMLYSAHFNMKPEEMMKRDLVAIDNLFTLPGCSLVKSFEYSYVKK
jgi:hypothetical protein